GFSLYGVSAVRVQNVKITSCKIDNIGATAVDIFRDVTAVISNSVVANSIAGIVAEGGATVHSSTTVMIGNGTGAASTSALGTSKLFLEACSIVGSGLAVWAGNDSGLAGPSNVWLSNNVIFGNVEGVRAGGLGQIYSYGNNK